MRIFKYQLEIVDKQQVPMPRGARILCAQTQQGLLMVWAEVDPTAPRELRTFHVRGTGHELPTCPVTYIDSVQMPPFMWHVFEERR